MTFVQLMGWPVAECACSARDQEAMLAFLSIDGTVVLILDRIYHHLSFIDPCIYLLQKSNIKKSCLLS